jgi:ADP-heptose:LPS heptosyltransferase
MPDPFTPGLLERLPEPPRKIAVLKAARIGDFLCSLPTLRALRHALPEAEISLITLPMLRELAERLPTVDRFLPFPGFPGIAEQLFEARRTLEFLARMQAEPFDLAIQLQGSGVNANPFLHLLGAQQTAGFIRAGDAPGLLDAALPLPEGGHEIERMLALPLFLGAPAQGRETSFPLTSSDRLAADEILAGIPAPLFGIHAAARDQTRRWAPERFAASAAALQREFGGTVLTIGEEEGAGLLESLARCGVRWVSLAGKTSLPVLGAVIARLALLLTNDSGPAHIAYALGAPSVTVFGSADPLRYGPPAGGPHRVVIYPVDCRPCGLTTCPIGLICLERVEVEEVVAAGREVMRGEVRSNG